jgi:DNA repair protein RAD51
MQAQKKKGKQQEVVESEPEELQQEQEDSHMDEIEGPTPIMKLQEQGISATDIKKLEEAGYHTIEAVAFTPKKHLILVKGLSEAKVDKILEACQKAVNLGFMTASSYFERRKDLIYISTGSKALDTLL